MKIYKASPAPQSAKHNARHTVSPQMRVAIIGLEI